MRLVRFEDESGGFAVDFHRQITVISGLPAHIRERLVHAVAAIPTGRDPGGRGTLEVHGVFLELTRDTLELLELTEDLDVVIRPGDLPAAPAREAKPIDFGAHYHVDTAAIDQARAALAQVEREYFEATEAVDGFRFKLDALIAERTTIDADAAAARRSGEPSAHSELERALAEVELARRAVESLHSDAESAAQSARRAREDQAARERDAAAQAEQRRAATHAAQRAEARRAELTADISSLEGQLCDAIERSNELKRQLRSLHSLDPEPVRSAYEALAPLLVTEDDADEQALVVARESQRAQRAQRIAAIDAVLGEWEQLIGAAHGAQHDTISSYDADRLERLSEDREAALEALEAIVRELDSPELDPDLVAQLESTHDQIFELDGQSPRFGAARHRRTLESLRATEAELLEQLGFETWSSYVMGVSAPTGPTEADYEAAYARFEEVDAALSAALADYEAFQGQAAAQREHQRRRDDLVSRSVELLGDAAGTALDDESIVDGLLAARSTERLAAASPEPEPQRPPVAQVPPESFALAQENLRWALDHAGIELPAPTLSAQQLCSLAVGWLEAMDGLDGRIVEVSAQRAELEHNIEALGARYEALTQSANSELDEPADSDGGEFGEAELSYAELNDAPLDPSSVQWGPDDIVASVDPAALHDANMAVAEAEQAVAVAQQRLSAEQHSRDFLEGLALRRERLDQREGDLTFSMHEREQRAEQLRDRVETARRTLSQLEASATEMPRIAQNLVEPEVPADEAAAEAIEWYILARLAQQRAVSFVGSVPVVFDNTFAGWNTAEIAEVLDRLQRMSEVIQVVVLTDDPGLGQWAQDIGESRAKVIDSFVMAP